MRVNGVNIVRIIHPYARNTAGPMWNRGGYGMCRYHVACATSENCARCPERLLRKNNEN